MTDAEKIEWLTATNKALMESQENLAGEVKELRNMLKQVSTIPDAVQFWRSRAEMERVEAFIKLIEMLPWNK